MTDLVTGEILPASIRWRDDKMIADNVPIGSRPVAIQLGKRSRLKRIDLRRWSIPSKEKAIAKLVLSGVKRGSRDTVLRLTSAH